MRERLRSLDRRIGISVLLAALVALLLLGLILFGPPEARFGSAIGLIALLVAAQVFILFFRPPDRSPLGLARTAFVDGRYDEAAALLETMLAARKTVPALVLLGNTYRQMGRLAESRAQLDEALRLAPRNAYALYGMGRTELAEGAFDAAAERFDQALRAGAPGNVACDLGFSEYFAGNLDAAKITLQKTTRILRNEPHRIFLTQAILYRLLAAQSPETGKQILQNLRATAEGLAYWQVEAERHKDTAYGQQLGVLLAEPPVTLLAAV